MRNHSWIRAGWCTAAVVVMLASAGPLAAQNRDDDDERSRTQQSRERDDRDQESRTQSQQRDREQPTRTRDQSQFRDQYRDDRDTSQYRDQPTRDGSEQDAGLGISLRETQDGVLIQQIMQGSPAERAGLRRGDLLHSIDDDRVRSAFEVTQLIREKEPGSWIDVTVWRGGQRQTLEARLASRQRALGEGVLGRQGLQQGPILGRQQQPFMEGSQSLAQQIQSLQRQLAQLRNEVDQLRSERQALRPSFDERDRTFDSRRQLDEDRPQSRSGERSRSNSDY